MQNMLISVVDYTKQSKNYKVIMAHFKELPRVRHGVCTGNWIRSTRITRNYKSL